MITFYQHIEEVKSAYDITSAAHISSIKRWYAQGAKKVRSALNRQYNKDTIYTDLVADQSFYQLPAYGARVHAVTFNNPGQEYPLNEVSSNNTWQSMKSGGGQTGQPSNYHISGDNEIELWPTPSENIEDGLKVDLSLRQPKPVLDDVTTGTATVANGNQTVVLSSGVVDSNWVGRYFCITDGSHEYWYKIVEYISSTTFKLENYYEGIAGSGRSYIVGDGVDLPEECLDLLESYVISKYQSIYRKNRSLGNDMMQEFKEELRIVVQDYASPSKGKVVKSSRHRVLDSPYPRWWPMDGMS